MMKRLFATTMLASAVTFGGGLAAQAADITIEGDSEFKYHTWSDDENNTGGKNDSKMSNESHIIVTAEDTSDSGITYGTYFRIEAETGNGGLKKDSTTDRSNLNEDGHRLYLSGDWGKLVLGGQSAGDTHYSDVMDRMVNDDSTSGVDLPSYAYKTALSGDEVISYHSPTVGGFTGAVSLADAGSGSKADATELGLAYTTDLMGASVTLRYATASQDAPTDVKNETTGDGKDDASATSLGFDVAYGDFGFGMSQNTLTKESVNKVGETTKTMKNTDLKNTGYAATYQVNSQLKLALGMVSAEDTHEKKPTVMEMDATAFAADYTIAPGLKTGLTYTTWSGQNTEVAKDAGGKNEVKDKKGKQSGTYTVLYMKVAF